MGAVNRPTVCVRTFTNTTDRLRNVWHNAGLIGSHVSAAMNSYVGVTCLARRVSEECGIAKSQTLCEQPFPPLHPPTHGAPNDTLHPGFRTDIVSGGCSFRKACYSTELLYRDADSVFFAFARFLDKYKYSEISPVRIRFLLGEIIARLRCSVLDNSLNVNFPHSIEAVQ